jgi:hypothetical protein
LAILSNDQDKLLQPGQQQPGASAGGAFVGTSSPFGNQGSGQVGGGMSQPQAGTGGSNRWTNIQSYLDANRGNQTSSKLVEDVGSKFKSEQDTLNKQANDARSQAEQEASKTAIGQDQASKLITDASKAQRGTDAYNQTLNPLKSAVTAKYEGPQSFAYGLDSQNQNYGQQLGDDKGFSGLMENLYKGAVSKTGNTISNGQLNLQRQLDLDPTAQEGLQNARNSAMKNFAGLNADFQRLVPETDQAIKGAATRFGDQQKSLVDFLGNTQSGSAKKLDDAVNLHNSGVEQAEAGKRNWDTDVQSAIDAFNQSSADWRTQTGNLKSGATVDNFMDYAQNGFNNLDQSVAKANGVWNPIKAAQEGIYSDDPAQRKRSADFLKVYNMMNNPAKYQAGQRASRESVGGVDEDRNAYNAISDVLGREDIIRDDPDAARALFERLKGNSQASDAINKIKQISSQITKRA